MFDYFIDHISRKVTMASHVSHVRFCVKKCDFADSRMEDMWIPDSVHADPWKNMWIP